MHFNNKNIINFFISNTSLAYLWNMSYLISNYSIFSIKKIGCLFYQLLIIINFLIKLYKCRPKLQLSITHPLSCRYVKKSIYHNLASDESGLIQKLQLLLEKHIKQIEVKNRIITETEQRFHKLADLARDQRDQRKQALIR